MEHNVNQGLEIVQRGILYCQRNAKQQRKNKHTHRARFPLDLMLQKKKKKHITQYVIVFCALCIIHLACEKSLPSDFVFLSTSEVHFCISICLWTVPFF